MAPVVQAANTGTQDLLTITGSGASIAFGDYVTNVGALDTQYSIFFEIPVGLTQFDVDLFDADILNGDGTGTIRDRERTGGTAVQYRLYDPNGTLVATLDCDDNTCADNAWTTLASYPQTGPATEYVLDQFGAVSYSNNDGTVNWLTDWIETNDDGQPDSGEIQISSGGEVLEISDNGGALSTITRSVNLSPTGNDFAGATLSFDFFTTVQVDGNDQMAVEVSDDGSTWVRLETFAGEFLTSESRSYDIDIYISSTTSVRFIRAQNYGGGNEIFSVDNLRIENLGSPLAFDAGHWELRIDQSSAITAGNDINGLGFRVHDGDPTSGGTEINAYLQSFAPLGSNSGGLPRTYESYPYLTSGCTYDVHDFDFDSIGSLQLDGPVSYTQAGTISGNDEWSTSNLASFTSLASSEEYGIWTLTAQIEGPEGGVGNYATLYATDFTGSATPPTSQPESGALRIYLPADGADGNSSGGGPGKFRLSQVLAFSSGTNPPTPGNPGRYGITVRAENPPTASGDVTFDGSNLIVSYVPGGNVVFVTGSEQTDTGTVNVNGSNVEWNPGTLAPGDVAFMWYQVEVSDDGSASIPVTGTPGSNGTRAAFTDETGEAGQGWSDGLCELSVDLQNPTAVTLRSFAAFVDRGGVVVEWVTDAEAGTIGFELWRLDTAKQDFVRINQHRLTGLLSSPVGGIYRLRDDLAPTQGDLTYMLVERESSGRERIYGPFTVAIDWDRQLEPLTALGGSETLAGDFAKAPHVAPKDPGRSRSARPSSDTRPVVTTTDALKLTVREPGLYRIGAAEIANTLGISVLQVLDYLQRGQFTLTQGGEPASWMTSADGQGLEFYGESWTSPFSAENVYRLAVGRRGKPSRFSPPTLETAPPARNLRPPIGVDTNFRDTVRIDKNLFPILVMDLPAESDFWFWDYVRFGDPSHEAKSFAFDLPGVDTGLTLPSALTIRLQGATAGEHQLELYLNGSWIGYATLADLESTLYTSPSFDQSLLQEAANTLELVAVGGDLVFLDYVEVEYDRLWDTGGTEELHHRADDNPRVRVTGFTSPDVRVFDLTDSRRPKRIHGAFVQDEGGRYSVTYRPKSSDALHLAVAGMGVHSPPSVVPDYPSDLRSPQAGADYLIITTTGLMQTAEALATYRSGQGHATRIVDVADIFDEFNHSLAHPAAIRDFLAYAYQNWSTPPRFVLLAANGTWDYRDNLGHGDNLLPPMFRAGSSDAPGLYATDYPYGDVVGDDWIWEMAVGRVSVTSPEQLQSYIDKVIAYENGFDGGPRDSVLVLTDNPDGAGDYLADGQALSALLPPGLTPLEIPLGPLDIDTAREQLFAALDMGVPMMTFHGHAGMTTLAHEGLLTLADLPALTNEGRAPVVNAVTCFVASFASPGFDSLAEGLVVKPDGGAAAFWASVYYAHNTQTQLLADRFFRQVFHEGESVLGEAVMGAIRSAAGHVSDGTLRRTAILGDPALRFQHQSVSIPPETTPGE